MHDEQAAPVGLDQEGLLAWLSDEVRSRRVSQMDIAAASGVHQSQVSRILGGKAKRASPNVGKLCKYAMLLQKESTAAMLAGAAPKVAINNAIMRIWDGSSEHASALVDLLGAVERVQRFADRKR